MNYLSEPHFTVGDPGLAVSIYFLFPLGGVGFAERSNPWRGDSKRSRPELRPGKLGPDGVKSNIKLLFMGGTPGPPSLGRQSFQE